MISSRQTLGIFSKEIVLIPGILGIRLCRIKNVSFLYMKHSLARYYMLFSLANIAPSCFLFPGLSVIVMLEFLVHILDSFFLFSPFSCLPTININGDNNQLMTRIENMKCI